MSFQAIIGIRGIVWESLGVGKKPAKPCVPVEFAERVYRIQLTNYLKKEILFLKLLRILFFEIQGKNLCDYIRVADGIIFS